MVQKQVHDAGGGNYQTLINDVLRAYIQNKHEPLEETLRRVLREEATRQLIASTEELRWGHTL